MKSGIYAIENTVTGKLYIGSAVNLRARKNSHISRLKGGKHHSSKLQRSWVKHGEEAFRFRVLMVCNKQDLLMYEQICITAFDTCSVGYNVLPTAGSRLGAKHSDAAKEKVAASKRGVRRPPFSEEHRRQMSLAHIGKQKCLGYKHTEEARANMRARVITEEHRAAISRSLLGNTRSKGFKHSEETRAKVSEANRGKKRMLGKRLSEDTRRKIGDALRGKPKSAEQRLKMAASARAAWAKRKGGQHEPDC